MTFLPTFRRAVTVAAAAVAGLAISPAAHAATCSGTASSAARAVPKCTASDLRVWLAIDQGNGAAGTIYYPLDFANVRTHTCSLFGYPRVSAISQDGQQLGSSAGLASLSGAQTVKLAPGAVAHTLLAYHDAVVSTEPGCDPVYTAAELRIYPPDQDTATYAAFGLEACSRPGPVYMNITEPIIPGVGTIYG
jgi:Protein of unknown function (DUF4232)